jgi:phosphoenolpyruvate carboxykinase (ATP)
MEKHQVNVWLINTGWTGGPYGVGHRMKLFYTRAMISAALDGKLDDVETIKDPVFGFAIPTSVPGVPSDILNPVKTWSDPKEYREKSKLLAGLFIRNFEKFAPGVKKEILDSAPVIS